jgi:hypothetical protein
MKKILLLFLISLLTFQIQAQKSKYVSSTIKPQERSNIEKSLNWASTSSQHILIQEAMKLELVRLL